MRALLRLNPIARFALSWSVLCLGALLLCAPATVRAETTPATPAAVMRDPPRDEAHPARLLQIRYRVGEVQVPARLFVAAGAGPHPSILLLHGFPGTELNLDLARTLQREGWNVLAIHYRGVWGAPGAFGLGHVVEDAHAALQWLRGPEGSALGLDPKRVVAVGHSMGGFATLMLGDDPGLSGYVLISAADMATRSVDAAAGGPALKEYSDSITYTNGSLQDMAAEARAHGQDWQWTRRAQQMAPRPVLVFTSDDPHRLADEAAAAAAKAAGSTVRLVHMTTDHSYNDHRIALASELVLWLEATFPKP
jgi:acetyl esterase/lipase